MIPRKRFVPALMSHFGCFAEMMTRRFAEIAAYLAVTMTKRFADLAVCFVVTIQALAAANCCNFAAVMLCRLLMFRRFRSRSKRRRLSPK